MHCPAYFVQNNELIALFSEGLANGFLYALIAIGYVSLGRRRLCCRRSQ